MKRKMMSLLLALAVISGSSVYAKVIDVMSPNGAIKVSQSALTERGVRTDK